MIMGMNRNTLDIAVPMVYAALIVLMWTLVQGPAAGTVTIVGAIVVGIYFAAIRQNIKPRQ
jgi:hypothetical protein